MATSASTLAEHIFALPRQARVEVKLNVRAQPSLQADRVRRFEPGMAVAVDRWVQGDSFLGVDRWYRIAERAEYIWSGGASLLEPAAPPSTGTAALSVQRRSNGSIRPLSVNQIQSVFGTFSFEDGSVRGSIRITTPGWEATNLVPLTHPLVVRLAGAHLRVHRLAKPHFDTVFDEIAARRLDSALLTCGGTFVARKIGWDPARDLSSHSWGIAIDLNERWNALNSEPALPGALGCLRELVPIFATQGFAWGGDFTRPKDGMHFELARTDP